MYESTLTRFLSLILCHQKVQTNADELKVIISTKNQITVAVHLYGIPAKTAQKIYVHLQPTLQL